MIWLWGLRWRGWGEWVSCEGGWGGGIWDVLSLALKWILYVDRVLVMGREWIAAE